MTVQDQNVGLTPEDPLEREFTPEPRPRTFHTIHLERVVNTPSPGKYVKYRLGEVFTYTYKSLNHEQARARAVAMLKAQGEDPLWWKELR